MRTVAFLLLFACAASAQDSIVERLETELRALVSRADAAADEALVTVAPAHWAAHPARVAYADRAGTVRLSGADAILIGTPPRLVAPYSAVGDAERVQVQLAGRNVTATRWGGDPDLGVVVFKLPDDVAAKGVDVEGDWARIGAGSVAVATDGRGHGGGKVEFVSSAEPRLGTIDATGPGTALFGSRGTLIGLRGGADMSSCLSCHQGGGWSAKRDPHSAAVDALGAYLRQDITVHVLEDGGMKNLLALDPMSGRRKAAPQATDHLVAGPVIRRVLDDLEKHGAIKHAFLGVVVGDVTGERAVQITTVVPDSPAAAAGLTAGQRIDAIDGLACPSAALFARVLVLHRPGDEVTLVTGGKEVKVKLGARAAEPANVATAEGLGLTCGELGDELRRFLGVDAELRGVAVHAVKEGSPAAKAGIRRGDVITAGGDGGIVNLEELKAALAGAKGSIELSGVRSTGAWTASLKY